MNFKTSILSTLSAFALAGTAFIFTASDISAKPLKIYVMAGQSNMQGRARDHTLPHMMTHPDTAYMAAKMVDYVNHIVGDIKRVYPDYDAEEGYEVAGFMWFQGENDFGDSGTYPNQGEQGSYDEYTRLFACLIRDLRKEFKTPAMPCIIGKEFAAELIRMAK